MATMSEAEERIDRALRGQGYEYRFVDLIDQFERGLLAALRSGDEYVVITTPLATEFTARRETVAVAMTQHRGFEALIRGIL